MLTKYKNDLYEQLQQLSKTLEHNKRALQERTVGLESVTMMLEELAVLPDDSLAILHQLPKILQNILQSQSVGVMILGPTGDTLLFNKGVAGILGTDLNIVESGTGPIKIYRGEKSAPYSLEEMPWRRAMTGVKVSGEKLFVERPDVGEGLWVVMECVPVLTPRNQVSSVLILMTDITEHYHLDGWLKKVLAGLDSQIRAFEDFDEELKKLTGKIDCQPMAAIVANLTESETESVLAIVPPAVCEALPSEERRVLIVDDIRVNLRLLGVQLKTLGFSVDVAHNGLEAVEMVAANDYGAVLMDCDMPVMDGYQATRKIREMEAGTGRHLPVIALTAYDRDGDKKRCLDSGMDFYLLKGVNARAIIEVMETYAFSKTGQLPQEAVEARSLVPEAVGAGVGSSRQFAATGGGSGAALSSHLSPGSPVSQVAQAGPASSSGGGDALSSGDDIAAFVDSYGKELGREIMLLFLRACSGLISSLDFALDEEDVDQINHFVYSIKGPAASIGARELVRLCSEVIRATTDKHWKEARVAYEELVCNYLAIQKTVGILLTERYGGTDGVDFSFANGNKQSKALKELIGSDQPPVGILAPDSGATPELIQEVAKAFFDDTTGSIERIKQAIVDQQQEELRFESHKLTGCAKVLDAKNLAQVSRRMEETALRGEWKNARENYLALVQAYNQAGDYLRKAMDDGGK